MNDLLRVIVDQNQRAIDTAACPHCKAKAGEQCSNADGRRSQSTHYQRRAKAVEFAKKVPYWTPMEELTLP